MSSPEVSAILRQFKEADVIATEGHCSPNQMQFFLNWLGQHKDVKTIFEIGFNAGHSAFTFLSARPDIKVVSLDLGAHDYVNKGKLLIDRTFPGRHTLIIGDSTIHLSAGTPTAELIKAYKPDCFFIDGGHDAPIPERDIYNCVALSKPGSWFIIDDVIDHHRDVMKGVRCAIESGWMAPLQQYKDGNVRGWLVAKPLF